MEETEQKNASSAKYCVFFRFGDGYIMIVGANEKR